MPLFVVFFRAVARLGLSAFRSAGKFLFLITDLPKTFYECDGNNGGSNDEVCCRVLSTHSRPLTEVIAPLA